MQNNRKNQDTLHQASQLQTENKIVNISESTAKSSISPTLQSASSANIQPLAAPPAEENGLRGEYFNNINFTDLQLTRTDPNINFDWGNSSPDDTIGEDTFSVRWTGRVRPENTGDYQFFTSSDDGVRLFIDGQLVIDRFRDQAETEVASQVVTLEAGQDYNIQLNYYEKGGAAVSRLLWKRPDGIKEIVPESQLFTPLEQTVDSGNGTGLRGQYYNNADFTDIALTRIDETINFDWGNGSPDPKIESDTFSVKWRGFVEPFYSETYTFYTTSDDGVRLKVNGETIINNLVDQGATEVASKPITLKAGKKYAIELEYYENGGDASSVLEWSSASQFKEIIPQSQLYAELTSPTATSNATTLNRKGKSTYTFSVDYTDDTSIDVSSIGDTDILVTGPNSFSQIARLVSINDGTNGTPRKATYQITAPQGIWGNSDNGKYTITLQDNEIFDISGNSARGSVLGSFEVDVIPPTAGKGLRAEYFNNVDFTDLALTRIDPTIAFDFDRGSPSPSIDPDTFSIRWSGQVQPLFSEDYIFYTNSDDGIRVKVNGQTVIDQFVDQAATEVASAPIALVAGEKYDILVEYYDQNLDAVAELSWSSPSQSKQIIPESQLFSESAPVLSLNAGDLTSAGQSSYLFSVNYSDDTAVDISTLDDSDIRITGPNGFDQLAELVAVDSAEDGTPRIGTYKVSPSGEAWQASDNGQYKVSLEPNQVSDISGNFAAESTLGNYLIDIPGTGTGLQGQYYDNIDFTNLNLTRTDATVNFNWGRSSPDTSIEPDTFSVVWNGQIEAKYSELYTFYATTDDGVRVFIDDELVIDSFTEQSANEASGTIALVAGQRYDIRIEYFENEGFASAELEWSSPTQTRQIVPSTQLYSSIVPATIRLGDIPTTVAENEDSVEVEIIRTGQDLNATSTVEYFTTGITADSGVDFIRTAGTVTFTPEQTRQVVSIPILDDDTVEPNEKFTFVVDQTENAILGPRRTATITILDDESTNLVIEDIRVNENAGEAIVEVVRGNTDNTASIDYTTLNDDNDFAQAGSDYQAVDGTLTFESGESTKTIAIPLINDSFGENNETFRLQFSNPDGISLDPAKDSSQITIIDDDIDTISRKLVVDGLTQPTSFDWAPIPEQTDEQFLLIAQKDGTVRVSRDGQLQQQVFIDLSTEVNNVRDRGLLGIAVHPDFDENPYVYLLYTYDPPEVFDDINPDTILDDPDNVGNRPSRLLKVTAEYIRDTNDNITGLRAVPDSGEVILGTNSTWEFTSNPDGNSTDVIVDENENIDFDQNFAPSGIVDKDGNLFDNMADYYQNLDTAVNVQDYLATDSESHSIGYVDFGPDGNLYVSNGDGTSYNRVDPRSIRVQDVDNLSGKLLRIDPITGEGLADNPFYDGDPDSNRSKVFNLGLRNPIRFTFDPETGQPYIGDVGWKTWEEANSGGAGNNYGWPFYEGGFNPDTKTPVNLRQPEYASLSYTYTNEQGEEITVAPAQDFYSQFGDSAVTAPIYAYEHIEQNSIIMGDFYQGDELPAVYQGRLFVADSSQSTIDSITLGSGGEFQSIQRFATEVGIPVQITTGPDESLYYADLGIGSGEGAIYRY